MRIPSGKTDQLIFFVAVDSTDLKTRETGLTSFTVYRSRNGGTATVYTTPTVAELSSSNMPGVYSLLIDEDTTIASTSDSEEYCVHITQASMAPVTRTIELYRRGVTTGNTLDVTATGAAGIDWGNVENKTTTNALTNTSIITTQKVDVDTIKTNPVVNAGTITFPTGATLASTTNITAGTITTVTNLTNAATSGDLTATMKTSVTTAATAATPTVTTGTISSGAINGASINVDTGLIIRANTATASAASTLTLDASASGTDSFYVNDWLVITSSTGIGQVRRISAYVGATKVATVSPAWTTTPSSTSTFSILPAARVDIAAILGTASVGAAGSVGIDWAQIANPSSTVSLSATTVATVSAVTGLTASNLDTTISSRMATYTQPTGFLAAAFPSGTIANTTNITAGTITTVTNLTNAPTAGDFTATMKTSLNAATPSVTVSDKTGFSLTSAYDPAKTASQAGDIMKVSSGTGVNQISLSSGLVTVGTNNDKTGYALTAAYDDAKTAAQPGDAMTLSGDLTSTMKTSVEDAVWDAVLADHAIVGSTGAALAAAGGSGDPWATALPGAYVAGTAGFIVGTNLDTTVSSRLASAGYTAPPSANTIATAVLTNTMTESYPSKGSSFTLAQGIYDLVQQFNEQSITGTTMTVKKRDQSTTAKTFTLNDATNPTGITEAT